MPDHSRPLNARGRRDVPVIGRWLADQHYPVDLVLSSTARRARETATGVATVLDPQPPVELDGALYAAPAEQILARIRRVPDDVATLVVCGHNPAMHELAAGLAEGGVDDFPTAALAVFAYDGEWALLSAGRCRLTAFVTPKTLAKQ